MPDVGTFGISKGSTSRIYSMGRNAGENVYVIQGNEESSLSITDTDTSAYNIWWEFPKSPDLNVEVAALTLPAFRTTEQQLKDFVPYIEFEDEVIKQETVTDSDGKVYTRTEVNVKVNLSFVNPSTMTKIDIAKISNITIDGTSYEEYTTSYMMNMSDTEYYTNSHYRDSCVIEYDYDGIRYRWNFDPVDFGNAIWPLSISVNSQASVNKNHDVSEFESIELFISDPEIASADKLKFSPEEDILLKGLKEGTTRGYLLYSRKNAE